MSEVLNETRELSFSINSEQDEKTMCKLARALASEERIKILRLLAGRPMNIYEIARTLDIPFSTASNHIAILEDSGIIFVSTQQGKKRHVKMCMKHLVKLSFTFFNPPATATTEPYTIEMPVGHFTEVNVQPPCGLYLVDEQNGISQMTATDKPNEMFTTDRFKAELVWFDNGYISYNFTNHLYRKSISKLELSFECCSEIIYYRSDWPSDITVKINDTNILTFTSPGDFGGRRGKYSPKEWSVQSTQYGLLYKVTIDSNGTYLNNTLVSKKTINDFDIASVPYIKISFGVDKDATHRGGINIFGKKFGDHNQAIVLALYP
ncbi:MAG: ArsR family transcriptional regulator [Clostridia bacterium]|nr:ArsR family transcriptional regulator [Clostridia bacterium]